MSTASPFSAPEYNSLPGFEIDEVSGLNFVRELVGGSPRCLRRRHQSFHLTCPARRSSTLLWTDVANPKHRQNYANVGAQVDLKFSVLHWYDMTLCGLRGGLPRRQARRLQWMISLKIVANG
jgi:hypothetical protein